MSGVRPSHSYHPLCSLSWVSHALLSERHRPVSVAGVYTHPVCDECMAVTCITCVVFPNLLLRPRTSKTTSGRVLRISVILHMHRHLKYVSL
ncbi:hypothetical protein DENSPDRAFT_632578 [Dentipellis sp. KUC8613]|nr:hypothetical protein DENSPDRAFT_632578 [Dentipellis sp. KUC8613]